MQKQEEQLDRRRTSRLAKTTMDSIPALNRTRSSFVDGRCRQRELVLTPWRDLV